MKSQDRYFIGPGLRVKLKEVITRVDGIPQGIGDSSIPVRLQDMIGWGGGAGRAAFRICTFTGSWSKNSAKTVTFKYQTTTPNTVAATNIFANLSVDCGTRNCAIARDGTAWFMIQAECS